MRWKLLMVAAALAALVGSGAAAAAARMLAGYYGPASQPPAWAAALVLLPPVAALVYACVFVYRHTARRRMFQAALTALLASILALAALVFGSLLARGRATGLAPQSSLKARTP